MFYDIPMNYNRSPGKANHTTEKKSGIMFSDKPYSLTVYLKKLQDQ